MSDDAPKSKRREMAAVGAEIYKAARESALAEITALKEEVISAREDGELIGFIKRGQFERQFGELLDAVILYRVKESKEYKKTGLTWASFCEAAGYAVRRADEIITDLRPIAEKFSADFATFSKVKLSQIRYLGKSVSAESATFDGDNIIVGEEKIPFAPENLDDINAAIQAQKDHEKELQEELEATKKAHDRVQSETHKALVRTEKELDRMKKGAQARGLTPPEEAFLKTMEQARISIDAAMLRLEPDQYAETLDREAATPRMVAAYLSTIDYARKQILAAYDTAEDLYSDRAMSPEAAWTPPDIKIGLTTPLSGSGQED